MDRNITLVVDQSLLTARGALEITDNTDLAGRAGSGRIDILDYRLLIPGVAAGELTVLDYSEIEGATITIGETTLTEGEDFNAETSNSATTTNIATAIDGITGLDATADGAVVSIEASAPGSAWNLPVSTDSEYISLLHSTLAGGQNPGTVTIGSVELEADDDFVASTSNAATATSLASAIDGLTGYNATATGSTITITTTEDSTKNAEIATVPYQATRNTPVAGARTPLTVVFDGDTYLAGTDFNLGATATETAVNIAAALDDNEDYTTTSSGAVVSVVADATGPDENTDLSTNRDSVLVTELVNGADAFTTEPLDYRGTTPGSLSVDVTCTALATGAEAEVTVQTSNDKETWVDAFQFTDITTEGQAETCLVSRVRQYARLLIEPKDDKVLTLQVNMSTSGFSGEGDDLVLERTL